MYRPLRHFYLHSAFMLFLVIGSFIPNASPGQTIDVTRKISWNQGQILYSRGADTSWLLTFNGSGLRDGYDLLPVYTERFRIRCASLSVRSFSLDHPVFEPLTGSMTQFIQGTDKLGDQVTLFQSVVIQRKVPYLEVSVLPLRRNPDNGILERLVSFSLHIELEENPSALPALKMAGNYTSHSVLSAGSWYKFAVASTGMYALTYNDLRKAGIDPSSIIPKNIRIYGNGGGMLPEANATPRTDDLMENAIYVSGEDDGQFGSSDFILFYGESPDRWVYDSTDHIFHHQKNIYSDKTYYFLNFDQGPGKRLGTESPAISPATDNISRFNDFLFYEKDEINLIKSGREWWDQQYFDVTTTRNYSFAFPNLYDGTPVKLTADVAARSTSGGTSFAIFAGSTQVLSISIPATGSQYTDDYAIERDGSASFSTSNPVIDIKLVYHKSNSSAIGYLNYLELNAMRLLKMTGSQLTFRSVAGAGPGKISEFTLTSLGTPLLVWDVTEKGNASLVETQQTGNDFTFRLTTDVIREFVAYDGSSFMTPEFTGAVKNQDLHGTGTVDYIIVTHPDFQGEAERLADFHRQQSNLSVMVLNPEQIYNEFSSGAQDISAIRDFMKMLYDRAEPGKEPKYLLLFGDASFDFKNRISNNTNFVPSYQSYQSLDPVYSYVSDDYFTLLDDNEGQGASGNLDLGVGRFPVATADEARTSVDKIIHYISNSDSVKNDWRNVVCFVADDQDEGGNMFIKDSEALAKIIETGFKDYNIDKIYLDAYPQVATPGGNRYPEVNVAINKRVGKGALIINYVGHGGEVGWAHERVLEVPDIKAWTNFNNLPIFMTATCEFSRFDDPERVSAGELVFLNPSGGGAALFTTTRLTFAGSNQTLSVNFYNHAFEQINGSYHRMGDLIVFAKYNAGESNARKFSLLGDPALQMSYPNLNVVTDSIRIHDAVALSDTLRALAEVTITGEIRDAYGQKVTTFNGTVFPTVFDKSSEVYTRANDQADSPYQFFLRKNAIYKGKAEIVDGSFTFTFIVPKDIAYNYGFGRISYYARDPETDANGYDETLIVGGYNNDAVPDNESPIVSLYINNRKFISGGITNQTPILLADISDESGVNTVGNGIGHDITAVLDQKTNLPLILNDYYVADLNTFKSGVLTYPFSALADGPHHVDLKVWDVYNNSTEAGIDFVVVSSAEFAFQHLINYPNPMRDHTTFSFETNQINQSIEVEIQIFNLYGGLLKTMRESLYPNGYRIEPFIWDGTTDQGWKIDSGIYVYRLRMTLPDGTVKQQSSKLVVIR